MYSRLSFLRGFTKNLCFKIFTQHCHKICPETLEECNKLLHGELNATRNFFVKLLISLYCQKYACCFSPGDIDDFCGNSDKIETLNVIRGNTWHKTIVTNNELPSSTALMLHSKRVSYVIKLNGNACVAELEVVDPLQNGWISDQKEGHIFPEWESKENKEIISMTRSAIFKKCGCKKTGCKGRCTCFKTKSKCTSLCGCHNCTNRTDRMDVDIDDSEDGLESDNSESDDSEEEDCNDQDENNEVDISDMTVDESCEFEKEFLAV